ESANSQLKSENNGAGSIRVGEGYKDSKGLVIERRRPGNDEVSFATKELPNSFAGKRIKVDVMIKYENLQAGSPRKYHHGGHVDIEAYTKSGPWYPTQTILYGDQPNWELH